MAGNFSTNFNMLLSSDEQEIYKRLFAECRGRDRPYSIERGCAVYAVVPAVQYVPTATVEPVATVAAVAAESATAEEQQQQAPVESQAAAAQPEELVLPVKYFVLELDSQCIGTADGLCVGDTGASVHGGGDVFESDRWCAEEEASNNSRSNDSGDDESGDEGVGCDLEWNPDALLRSG